MVKTLSLSLSKLDSQQITRWFSFNIFAYWRKAELNKGWRRAKFAHSKHHHPLHRRPLHQQGDGQELGPFHLRTCLSNETNWTDQTLCSLHDISREQNITCGENYHTRKLWWDSIATLTESTTMFGEDDNNTCFCAVFGMVNMAEERREKT
jgi:hypothetical protein